MIFLETDDAGLGDDVNVTINAEMDDAAGTDSTDKVFFGVLDQEFLSGSITGVVSDDNDNPVDARIYVSELVDEDAGVTITFEPESVNNLEQFTATVYDGNDNVVETVELTAEEMANFEFQGFNSQLSLAEGEDSFELLADRAADRTTLSPVPAVDADPGVSLALTGVSQTGETGTSVSTAIEVDRTSTASIVIEGVDQANFQVDNLDPEDATIDQGDDLTVTADITNTGDLGGTQNVGLTIFDGDDAVVEETQTLELDAGASETVEFTLEDVQLDAGDYVHRIHTNDDEAEGSLTVEAGDDDGPSLANYTNEDGETTTDLLRQAIDDWRNDDIDTDLLRDVIDNWRN